MACGVFFAEKLPFFGKYVKTAISPSRAQGKKKNLLRV
jgi:hypothetical protein